jgi:hypothetical protein
LRCLFTHFVKVFFCMASRSSETKNKLILDIRSNKTFSTQIKLLFCKAHALHQLF